MLLRPDMTPEQEIDWLEREAKRPNRQREHDLQTVVKVYVGRVVTCKHRFLAFDRAQKMSRLQHIRERARGIEAGCADTWLGWLPPGEILGRDAWGELKIPPNKPTDNQLRIGRDCIDCGHPWFWTTSVVGYFRELVRLRVPLSRDAEARAEGADRQMALRWSQSPKAPRRQNDGRSRAAPGYEPYPDNPFL